MNHPKAILRFGHLARMSRHRPQLGISRPFKLRATRTRSSTDDEQGSYACHIAVLQSAKVQATGERMGRA
jgi:hypothetical protein